MCRELSIVLPQSLSIGIAVMPHTTSKTFLFPVSSEALTVLLKAHTAVASAVPLFALIFRYHYPPCFVLSLACHLLLPLGLNNYFQANGSKVFGYSLIAQLSANKGHVHVYWLLSHKHLDPNVPLVYNIFLTQIIFSSSGFFLPKVSFHLFVCLVCFFFKTRFLLLPDFSGTLQTRLPLN